MSDPAGAPRLAQAAAATALAAALAVAGASTLPWAVVTRAGAARQVNGLAVGGGWSLLAAATAAVFPALGLAARRPRLAGWCVLPGLFAIVVTLAAGAALDSEDLRMAVLAPGVGQRVAVSTQSGVWLALGAAAALFAAGATAALSRAEPGVPWASPAGDGGALGPGGQAGPSGGRPVSYRRRLGPSERSAASERSGRRR